MSRVPSSPNGLDSDAGDYRDTSAAYTLQAAMLVGETLGGLSPRHRSASGWEDYQAVFGRADIKDYQSPQSERRAPGRRLKHKWSAVKLASTGEDIDHNQAHASGQTAVDRFRALSPASQEALLQQREQRSSTGIQEVAQREYVRSPSMDRVPAEPAAVNTNAKSAVQLNEKPRGDLSRSEPQHILQQARARTQYAVKQSRESKGANAWSTAVNQLAAARGERANTSTRVNILDISDPSSQFTVIPPRRRCQGTAQQERRFQAEQDIESMQQQSQSVLHSTSTTDDTDIAKAELSCGGCSIAWCQECTDVWSNNAGTFDAAPKSEILSADGDWNEETHPRFGGSHGADTDFSSMAYETIAPRYLEDGPTWGFDTLGVRSSSTDDGSKFALVSGSDNGECVERRVKEDFGDDSEAAPSRSSTPVRYTLTSGSENECIPSKSVTEANSILRGTLEATAGKGPETESLVRAVPSKTSSEQALGVFGLGDYFSVDMGKLQERLQNDLWRKGCNRTAIANAFNTIIKHQDETDSWDLRLRWDCDSDQFLLNDHLGTHHDNWEITADEYRTTEEDCHQRWAILKPKGWRPKSVCNCATTGNASCCCCPVVTWTPSMDEKLMSLKADSCSWADIATRFWDLDEANCKARFKQIKPKGWKPNWKKQTEKQTEKQKNEKKADVAAEVDNALDARRTASSDISEANNLLDCGHCADDGWGCGCFDNGGFDDNDNHEATTAAPEMGLEEAYALLDWAEGDLSVLRVHMLNAPSSKAARLEKAYNLIRNDQAQNYGWGDVNQAPGWSDDVNSCCDCGVREGWCTCAGRPTPDTNGWDTSSRHEGSSDPQPAPYVPLTVTYCAIIDSGGKEIHVPIADKHVSGPEKSIVTGGMQKVWKWVHDKGLGDKIGLQDAFDLVQSMHTEKATEGVKKPWVESRAESVSSHRTR